MSDAETFRAYDDVQSRACEVLRPATLEAVRDAVRGRGLSALTLRGAGHAFDGHALGARVLQLGGAFERVGEPYRDASTGAWRLDAGAAAPWGEVFARALARGLVPYTLVTSSHATVGGTLAGNCLSRFSPCFGREGDHVASIEVVAADGSVKTCGPAQDADLFASTVGGFGLSGVITAATIALRPLPEGDAPPKVRTVVDFLPTFAWSELLDRLAVERAGDDAPADVATRFAEVWFDPLPDGIPDGFRCAVLESRYVRSHETRPMLVHQPEHPLRTSAEVALCDPYVNALVQDSFFAASESGAWLDDPRGFTFFMDGNTIAKRDVRARGGALRLKQSSYALPTRDAAARFLARVEAAVRARRAAVPAMFDVLHVPPERHRTALCASRGFAEGAWVITLAYQRPRFGPPDAASDDGWVGAVRAVLRGLSADCDAEGGRTHLVKNVEMPAGLFEKQYGDALREVRAAGAGAFDDDLFARLAGPHVDEPERARPAPSWSEALRTAASLGAPSLAAVPRWLRGALGG